LAPEPQQPNVDRLIQDFKWGVKARNELIALIGGDRRTGHR